jgi:hypothetical protein
LKDWRDVLDQNPTLRRQILSKLLTVEEADHFGELFIQPVLFSRSPLKPNLQACARMSACAP